MMRMMLSPSLVCLCLSITSKSVGAIRQLFVQISSMYGILMGYCMADQVRNMMISVMYKSKLNIEIKSLGGSS